MTRVNCGSSRYHYVKSFVTSTKTGAVAFTEIIVHFILFIHFKYQKQCKSVFRYSKICFRIYDYYKLSNILTLQSSAFQNILTTFRPHPEYFKVSFFGGSYPLFVRNKEFIYRGLDFEKISDFTQRLCAEFPEANLVTKVDKFH